MRLLTNSIAVVTLLAPGVALAGATYVPDTGATARARGGAFAAAANDPMAIVYNPAGFADQREMQVYVDVVTLTLNNTFDRADSDCPPDAPSCGKVTNTGAPKISPNLIWSMPVGESFVVHAGAYGAMGVNYKYPADGPQRFTVIDLTPQQLSYSAGLAWRAHKMFAIGFTAGGMYLTNETSAVATSNVPPTQPSENPVYDRPATLTVSQAFAPTANIGVKINPMEKLEIGLSYRPVTRTNMGGEYESASLPEPEKVHLKVNLPWILRSGVRWVEPTWDAEVDFVIEDWSARQNDVIAIDDGDLAGRSAIRIAREAGAAYSVRVGGSYKPMDALQIHAGVLHETAAIPKERLAPNIVDLPKTGLGLGASYSFGKYTVTGNVTYIALQTTTVTNSENKQNSAIPVADDSHLTTVGNGVYEGNYTMGGLSFRAKF